MVDVKREFRVFGDPGWKQGMGVYGTHILSADTGMTLVMDGARVMATVPTTMLVVDWNGQLGSREWLERRVAEVK